MDQGGPGSVARQGGGKRREGEGGARRELTAGGWGGGGGTVQEKDTVSEGMIGSRSRLSLGLVHVQVSVAGGVEARARCGHRGSSSHRREATTEDMGPVRPAETGRRVGRGEHCRGIRSRYDTSLSATPTHRGRLGGRGRIVGQSCDRGRVSLGLDWEGPREAAG